MFACELKISLYFELEVSRHFLHLHEPVHQLDLLLLHRSFMVRVRYEVPDAPYSVSKHPAGQDHGKDGIDLLLASLWRDVSVAYSGHGSECPVHACDVLVLLSGVGESSGLQPSHRFEFRSQHCHQVEQTCPSMSNQQDDRQELQNSEQVGRSVSQKHFLNAESKSFEFHKAQEPEDSDEPDDPYQAKQLRSLADVPGVELDYASVAEDPISDPGVGERRC